MDYNERMKISVDHLYDPKPGDYWHERMFPILVVLELTNNGKIIVANQIKECDGGKIFDLKNPKIMSSDEFIEELSYASIPGKPIGMVSVTDKFKGVVDDWHTCYRDEVLVRLMTEKQHNLLTPINIEDLHEWAEDKQIEYANMTVRGSRLRLIVIPSSPLIYTVTYGSNPIYRGDSAEKAVNTFNQKYAGE